MASRNSGTIYKGKITTKNWGSTNNSSRRIKEKINRAHSTSKITGNRMRHIDKIRHSRVTAGFQLNASQTDLSHMRLIRELMARDLTHR